VFLFGYSTLIGWAYYGEQFFEYCSAARSRAVSLDLLPADPVRRDRQGRLVWAWGDLMNALQVFPNLIGVLG
jgi:AGCS family alanine or glycine:cation symporter